MNLQLDGKVVIVSGGAKGIGFGIIKQLSAEGAIPVIIGRNENENSRAIEGLGLHDPLAHYVTAELTKQDECKRAVEQVAEKFGRIDGLVNNAGLNDGVGLENGNYDAFILSLHRNIVHYYLLAHYALPLLKQNSGSIVNISSKTGETGQGGTSGYAASNGARNALTREWAVELLKYNIRVNAIVVAECWTPQYENWITTLPDAQAALTKITSHIPLGNRMTTVEEIANMTVFLLSSASSHTTGQIIHVDGGYVHLDRALVNA